MISNHLLTSLRQQDLPSPPSPVPPLSPTDTLRGSSIDVEEPPLPAHETAEATEALEERDSKMDLSPSFASCKPFFESATASGRARRVQGIGDPLGPSAVFPYFPTSDENEGLRFSCRPGGPRLFDLVARFPASEYGLTSWSLIERDEELFEIDDVRDEDKAMQALWNRWIFFERRYFSCFCKSYLHPLIRSISQHLLDAKKTTMEFVDKFRTTITETAGWKGMRVWLLASFSICHYKVLFMTIFLSFCSCWPNTNI